MFYQEIYLIEGECLSKVYCGVCWSWATVVTFWRCRKMIGKAAKHWQREEQYCLCMIPGKDEKVVEGIKP